MGEEEQWKNCLFVCWGGGGGASRGRGRGNNPEKKITNISTVTGWGQGQEILDKEFGGEGGGGRGGEDGCE